MSYNEVAALSAKLDRLAEGMARLEEAQRRDHEALAAVMEERTFLKRKILGLGFSLLGAVILALGAYFRRFLKLEP
jgi:hypothetical protein